MYLRAKKGKNICFQTAWSKLFWVSQLHISTIYYTWFPRIIEYCLWTESTSLVIQHNTGLICNVYHKLFALICKSNVLLLVIQNSWKFTRQDTYVHVSISISISYTFINLSGHNMLQNHNYAKIWVKAMCLQYLQKGKCTCYTGGGGEWACCCSQGICIK